MRRFRKLLLIVGLLACTSIVSVISVNLVMTKTRLFTNVILQGNTQLAGDHAAFGSGIPPIGYVGTRFTQKVVSNGRADFVAGLDIDPTITLTNGDNNYANYVNIAGFGITTQPSQNVDIVSALRIADPQIMLGADGSVSEAATVYIYRSPTEGVTNASLLINSGDILQQFGDLYTLKSGRKTEPIHTIGSYNDDVGFAARLRFQKSWTDNLGENVPTIDGTLLGVLEWFGVDSGSIADVGARIGAFQLGAAGRKVPTYLSFRTSTSNEMGERMRIMPDGRIGIGTTNPVHRLEIAGTVGCGSLITTGTVTALGGLVGSVGGSSVTNIPWSWCMFAPSPVTTSTHGSNVWLIGMFAQSVVITNRSGGASAGTGVWDLVKWSPTSDVASVGTIVYAGAVTTLGGSQEAWNLSLPAGGLYGLRLTNAVGFAGWHNQLLGRQN